VHCARPPPPPPPFQYLEGGGEGCDNFWVSEEHWMVAWKVGWLGDEFMWAGQVMAGYKSTRSGGGMTWVEGPG
jgi:hypothetical protein